MKKLGLLAVIALVFASCGDDSKTKEQSIDLKTFKEKISYVLGSQQAKMITESGDPNLDKLSKEDMILGFNQGMTDEEMSADCQDALSKLYGPYGQDFDTNYVKKGSNCIGKIAGSVFFQTWTKKGVMDQVDIEIAKIGFKQGLYKVDTLIDMATSMTMMTDFVTGINKKAGTELMAKANQITNKKVIEGGIVIETLSEGTGGSPAADDDVQVNYILTSAFGDTVENSFAIQAQSGQAVPAFNLQGVIRGWGVSFPELKKGGKYNLYIPWEMAYGEQNQCETLKFYVELNDFGPKGTLAKPQQMQGM